MKKLFLVMAIGLGMLVVSCTSKEEKAIDLVKEATEQIKDAESMEDIEKITDEMEKKSDDLGLSEEEEKALLDNPEFKKAVEDMMSASVAKGIELATK